MITSQGAQIEVIRTPVVWRPLVAATVLATATIAVIWFIAVPVGPVVCPAIYPSPPNCFAANRAGTGLWATVATVIVWVGSIVAGLSRPHLGRIAAKAGIGLLAIAPFVSYVLVAWAPGPLLA